MHARFPVAAWRGESFFENHFNYWKSPVLCMLSGKMGLVRFSANRP